VEVSRYRPLTLAWASLLGSLLCLVAALALDSSAWIQVVTGYAVSAGVTCLVDRFHRRRRLLTRLEEARPLPLGAFDVSEPERDVLLLVAWFFAANLVVTAGAALVSHDSVATTLALLAGAPLGLAVGNARDSRVLARWEQENGRLFVENRRIAYRKRGLYVEDPADAPVGAS
jgi:hypothetical protein